MHLALVILLKLMRKRNAFPLMRWLTCRMSAWSMGDLLPYPHPYLHQRRLSENGVDAGKVVPEMDLNSEGIISTHFNSVIPESRSSSFFFFPVQSNKLAFFFLLKPV